MSDRYNTHAHASNLNLILSREATVTALPPGGTISLGVSRAPSPEDDKEILLGKSKLGDGEKTWGFCTSNGGGAGTVRKVSSQFVFDIIRFPPWGIHARPQHCRLFFWLGISSLPSPFFSVGSLILPSSFSSLSPSGFEGDIVALCASCLPSRSSTTWGAYRWG